MAASSRPRESPISSAQAAFSTSSRAAVEIGRVVGQWMGDTLIARR